MPPFGKKKGSKNEVVFQVHIHSIEPWPRSAADKPLVLAWERGTSHKGTLDASQPDVRSSGVVFEFEETIVVPCTLVQVHFRKTCLSCRLAACLDTSPCLEVFCAAYKHRNELHTARSCVWGIAM